MQIQLERDFKKIENFLQNNFSSPTHWPDWNLVISKYFKTDFFYYTAIEDGKIIGIIPTHFEKNGILKNFRSGQINFIPFGGWIFSKQVKILEDYFPINSLSSFQSFCLPSLSEFGSDFSDYKSIIKQTLIISLDKSIEDIWNESVHSKRRNMVRKAEKKGVLIKTDYNIDRFYDIYIEASERSNLTLHPKELFFELFNESKNIFFEIISAEFDGELIANVVIVYDKDYSIYWLGNNANNVPNLGQGDLLQWEAIKRMKKVGCKYYDLCYIEKEKLPQIYKFKSGFSNTEIDVQVIYNRPIIYRVLKRMQKWH